MSLEHSHQHDHHQCSQNKKLSQAFKIGISLNLVFVFIEFYYGYISKSVALVADAFHNLTDVFSLVLALVGFALSHKKNGKKNSALISIINNGALLITTLILVIGSFQRINEPTEINSLTALIVASIGIFINLGSAHFFQHHQHDLNAQGAYLHLMADAALSLGVVISSAVIYKTGLQIIDPITSIIICFFIFISTSKLLKKSISEYQSCISS